MADRLPEYMVPSAIVLLDALPLTANGKVDRQRLPAADVAKGAAEDRHVAPRTEMEAQLATIWQEVLKRDRIGATDDFLDLGGHSLLAIRVLGRISKTFGVRLALRTLFDAPTVEQLALAVERERGAAATAAPAPGGMGGIVPGAYRIGKTAPAGGTGGGLGGAS
jgi:acyl carrier protein